MPVPHQHAECRVLVADANAADIEFGEETIDIQLPLTGRGFRAIQGSREGEHVSVRSADGIYFIGNITGIDEDRYVITVELS